NTLHPQSGGRKDQPRPLLVYDPPHEKVELAQLLHLLMGDLTDRLGLALVPGVGREPVDRIGRRHGDVRVGHRYVHVIYRPLAGRPRLVVVRETHDDLVAAAAEIAVGEGPNDLEGPVW